MVDFASSRFSVYGPGTRLHRILNDTSPNSEHLGVGSTGTNDGNDVFRVQNAFYDLGWTMRIDPPEPVFTEMVTDYFGERTYGVALAYKSHYGLLAAGASSYTGNVGPQTLARLDYQCTLYDASLDRIITKASDLDPGSEGLIQLGDEPGPNPMTVLGTSAVYWAGIYYGEYGHFCDEADTSTSVVHGAIYNRWADEGWMLGSLGLPTSDVIDVGDGTRWCDFVGGRITQDADGGTAVEYWS